MLIRRFILSSIASFALFHAYTCFVIDTYSEFDQKCQTNTFGDRNCSFLVPNNWNFLKFREWLEKTNEHIGDVSLDLTCMDGGTVFLPWPFRARTLRKIQVRNCLIDGYYSEFNVESKYPNTVKDMALIDVAILSDINQLIEMNLNDPLVKSSTCGQETNFRFIQRNVTFSFVPSKEVPSFDRLSEAFDSLAEKSKTQPFTCHFENLVYLEHTGSKSVSRIHFDTMTDHSVYPKLKVFNFSSNYLPTIPRQLTRWLKFFPSLRLLDLSNNEIREFSFEHPDVSQNSLYISLANNNITSVPADLPTYLNGKTPVLINLLGNPIHCDCRASVLSQYLKTLRRKAPQFKALSNVKCHSPRAFAGRKVRTVNFKLC
ncbi:uncharacterized protein LOC125655675 [Ostrea edulis]|uniref:uncharacterized protein LOC125655675 n=1 Tax=Ostrea edulis TaxID=37623 RepID=UPI002094A352|nr:uncharacterized protein LOC125655675 [Ostrea edulis]